MTDWFTARRLAHELGAARPRTVETVEIADAAGRTLAEGVVSLAPLPGYSSSAMDGWVVAGDGPWLLGRGILAGDPPGEAILARGTARAIATGAPIPPGARGVLRREYGEVRGDVLRPGVDAPADSPHDDEHIRAAGEESAIGQLLLAAGLSLTPPRIALAAVAGLDALTVVAQPTAEVLVLGSEIVSSGIPAPGTVRDAYSPHLRHLLAAMGAQLASVRQRPDSLEVTAEALRSSTGSLMMTTGGTAKGPADHIHGALDAAGARHILDGVAMRPGHPVVLAQLSNGRPVLCLPGNPFAAMIALASIGVPLIDGMLGRPLAPLGRTLLAVDISNPGSQTRLVAVRWTDDGAAPTGRQGSAMLRGLAEADGVAAIPPGGAALGEPVPTLPLPW